MMMPVTENATPLKTSSFVPPIPVPPAIIPMNLGDVLD